MKKILYIIVTVCMLLFIGAGCSSKTKLNLSDYLSVEIRGAEGKAIAVGLFDFSAFEKDVTREWNEDNSSKKLIELTALEDTIKCTVNPAENLKNGDKVSVTVSYDKSLADEYGYSFKETEKTFEVKNLVEAINIDPFGENAFGKNGLVTISYSGIAPYASVSIKNKASMDDPLHVVTYTVDKKYNLRNGDLITLSAEISDEDMARGYSLLRTQEVIKVEGLGSVVMDISAVNSEDMQVLRNKCAEVFNASVKNLFILNFRDGERISLSNNSVGAIGELQFTDTCYAVPENNGLVIFPYTVDLTDISIAWYGNTYHEPALKKSCEQVTGYFFLHGIVLNADGDLVSSGDVYYDMTQLFETVEQAEEEYIVPLKESYRVFCTAVH